jgi:hypothetical protein
MKTVKKIKLDFNKRDVISLNEKSLIEIKGGWPTTSLSNITTITNFSKDTLCTSDVK